MYDINRDIINRSISEKREAVPLVKDLFSKINLRILNAAAWITLGAAYVLPFGDSGFSKTAGFPFAFLSVYENTADSLFDSFHVGIGALVLDIAAVYALLVCVLKISYKIKGIKDKR